MNFNCQHCHASFSSNHTKRKFCSFDCSVKARNRDNWHQYENRKCEHCKSYFEIITWSKKRFCTHACSSASRRGRENGRKIDTAKLRRKRVARVKIEGRTVFLHRHLVEMSIGRALMPRESVHHIDCDSFNNIIENLHLFADEQLHQLAHSSIERLVSPLMKLGIIEFESGSYKLSQKLSALAVAVTAIHLQG